MIFTLTSSFESFSLKTALDVNIFSSSLVAFRHTSILMYDRKQTGKMEINFSYEMPKKISTSFHSFVTKTLGTGSITALFLLRLSCTHVGHVESGPRVVPSTKAWRGHRISADGSNIEYVSRLLFFICMAIILPH